MKPQLFSSNLGGKQYVQICDLVFPKQYCFDKIIIDTSINMAIIHQMILRYISVFFRNFVNDPKISILKYDQLIVLLKNKFLNAPNEDEILEVIEKWLEGRVEFRIKSL